MYSQIAEAGSWIDPEILQLGKKKVDAYQKREPRLALFAHQLDNTLWFLFCLLVFDFVVNTCVPDDDGFSPSKRCTLVYKFLFGCVSFFMLRKSFQL